MASAQIYATRTISGNQPAMRRLKEATTQTFKAGTPVQLTGGFVAVWDGTTVLRGIAGITKEAGSSLTTAGVAKQLTFGEVPNESAAVNIARPSFNDGMVGVELANQDSVFFAQVVTGHTLAQTDIGTHYGMTLDSDGHWYVDTAKTTIGTNTVCVVVGLSANDTRGVYIIFEAAVEQLPA